MRRSRLQAIPLLWSVLALIVGCQGEAASLQSIVEDMSQQAGSDVVAALQVTQTVDGLDVSTTFLQDDGSAAQFRHSPGQGLQAKRAPGLSVPLSGVPMSKVELPEIEQRLTAFPDCDEARAAVFVAGEHIVENIWCAGGDASKGRLDGEPVSVTAAGDLPTAAQNLVEDAALLDATKVGRVSITMTATQVWSTVQVVAPALPNSAGNSCSVLFTRTGESLLPVCEVPLQQSPAEALDPEVITRIWEAEGQPSRDWTLQLVGDEEPYWQAVSGKRFTSYALDGERR